MPNKEEYSALRNELQDLWKYCRSLHYIGFAFVLSLNYLLLKPILESPNSNYQFLFVLAIAAVVFGQFATIALVFLHKNYMSAIFRLAGYITVFHDYYKPPAEGQKDYGWHFWNRVEASSTVRNRVRIDRRLRMVFVPLAFGPFELLLGLSLLPLLGLSVFALLDEKSPPWTVLPGHPWVWWILGLIAVISLWTIERLKKELDQETERWVRIWSWIRNEPKHVEDMVNVIEKPQEQNQLGTS